MTERSSDARGPHELLDSLTNLEARDILCVEDRVYGPLSFLNEGAEVNVHP